MNLTETLRATPWLHPLNDVAALDDLLATLHPTWALGRIKARVLAIHDETPDVKTFVLRANRQWPGHRAGQHVGVDVAIDGVRHQRRYSVSSAPGAGRSFAITVKRQTGGGVSSWLHERLRVGDVVAIDPPAGDFVLPNPLPTRLVMVSAGSGITPLMAMLRVLARRPTRVEVAFVHVSRGPAIFERELRALAAATSWLALRLHDTTRAGRFDPATVAELAPDRQDEPALLCGPPAFMRACRAAWRGRADLLRTESFGGFVAGGQAETCHDRPPSTPPATGATITCARTERSFTSDASVPLLVAAERAGLAPRYGCRMGICRTCRCVKLAGTVENALTGAVSSRPGERIQLCISRARGDVTLDL